MSSFIGHGLTALAIGKLFESKTIFRQKFVWQTLLVLCAFAPDIDYAFPRLNYINNNGLRITHSIAFSLILPLLITFYLLICNRKNAFWGGVQLALAGLSHLFLDMLVGSRQADPFLFPFFNSTFKPPLGILPGSASLRLENFYFYRNVLIECGILVPVFVVLLTIFGKIKTNRFLMTVSIIVSTAFLIWSINLKR